MPYFRADHFNGGGSSQLIPELSVRDVYQRVSLMVGAYLYAFSGTSRLGDLIGDPAIDPSEQLLETTVAFCAAGMLTTGEGRR